MEPAKEKLLEIEQDGIIVKDEGHTPWVSSMIVIEKNKKRIENHEKVQPNEDEIRMCIDLTDLNPALKRVHHPMITIEEVANKLSDAAMFITLDACSGFWQLPMDEDSSKPLTFNTPGEDIVSQDYQLVLLQHQKRTKEKWKGCLKESLLILLWMTS